jgi:hypothetical protein
VDGLDDVEEEGLGDEVLAAAGECYGVRGVRRQAVGVEEMACGTICG